MRFALLTAAVCLLGSCAPMGDGEDTAYRPQVILDSYMIAHGMAASYVQNANASPTVVQELFRLDQRAALAVHALAQRQGADPSESANAVAALAGYAASQTTDTTQQ